MPKPQWEKDSETLAALRKQTREKDAGRHARYNQSDGMVVTMWSGVVVEVSATECTPYVAANFLDFIGMGSASVLKPIFEVCTLFQAIAPAKSTKPLITFF
jgi:hypothetical protein